MTEGYTLTADLQYEIENTGGEEENNSDGERYYYLLVKIINDIVVKLSKSDDWSVLRCEDIIDSRKYFLRPDFKLVTRSRVRSTGDIDWALVEKKIAQKVSKGIEEEYGLVNISKRQLK